MFSRRPATMLLWLFRGNQSVLMLAAFATAAHFRASAVKNIANSWGEELFGSAPSRRRLACISTDLSPSLITALSLPTALAGVPTGARRPFQYLATKPS